MLTPTFGIFDYFMASLGLGSHNWLGDPDLALVSVIVHPHLAMDAVFVSSAARRAFGAAGRHLRGGAHGPGIGLATLLAYHPAAAAAGRS